MARVRSFANVTACRAVSNPAWCRIFREILCFSPLNIGPLFRCCVLGQGTLPSHASLDSGVNDTKSTVLPVPTRHRRHACIKMRTALAPHRCLSTPTPPPP